MRRASLSTAKGFTLVELLVVVAIIGILATVATIAYVDTRKKARDARRITDLTRIRDALELYFQENGEYPPVACGYDCNGYYGSYSSNWNALAGALSPYIKLPVDPINSSCLPYVNNCYSYMYGNVGHDTYSPQYTLTARLEDSNNPVRCGLNDYRYYFTNVHWCTAFGGSYSNQIFEAGHR
jgi:prepilin-type N-terminal cleavage/methylation domain-containing protein